MKIVIIRRIIIVSATLLLSLQPSSSRPGPVVSETNDDGPPPSYSLYEAHPHEYPVYTRRRGVVYYVRLKDYEKLCSGPSSLELRQKIEESVERDFLGVLMRNCQLETQQQLLGLIRDTPHCTLLEDFASEDYDSVPPLPKAELL